MAEWTNPCAFGVSLGINSYKVILSLGTQIKHNFIGIYKLLTYAAVDELLNIIPRRGVPNLMGYDREF